MARFSINLRDLVILVADPRPAYMSMLIHSMLRGFGSNKVLEARSSTSVLQVLTNQKIDILDLQLAAFPPHGGLPLTRAIRRKQDNANRTIPILVNPCAHRSQSYSRFIKSLGFDPIWFGVIKIVTAEVGMITPLSA